MNHSVVPAATIVLLRESKAELEVLLLRRNPDLAFAANNWVFPGGKVEPEEINHECGDLFRASKIAAIRECLEETQVDISKLELTPISHWTTPKFRPKRFATQFFISKLPNACDVTVDQSEIIEFQWLSATNAIQKHQDNELVMMPPTLVTLNEISKFNRYEDIIKYYSERENRSYNPRMKIHENDDHVDASFLYEGDSGYDQTDPLIQNHLNRCEMKNGVIKYICNID